VYKYIELKTAPELLRVIRAAEPTYRKRQVRLETREQVSLANTYWDGGSRSTYTAVNLSTMRSSSAEQFAPPQFGGPRQAPIVNIPEGVAIVETGVFAGKPATAAIYLHPYNMAQLLTA
jgi:hypothetical protein